MSDRTRLGLVIVSLALMFGSWSLGTPPNAGPDEPAHLIRAAGLVRGDLLGSATSEDASRSFDVPWWVGQPDPGCYAFQPQQGASCAATMQGEGDVSARSSAAAYPPWAHLLPGVATLLPGGPSTLWYSRLLAAIPALLLVAVGFMRVRQLGSSLSIAAAMAALTPAAVFSIVVVNPSGLAVAGAFATLAAGLGLATRQDSPGWLYVAGAAALAASRSDGAVWAAIVIAATVLTAGASPGTLWRLLNRGQRVVILSSLTISAGWAAMFKSPLLPVPTEARGVNLLVVSLGRTGLHLDEAVGLFSWADTSMPVSARYLWWGVVGGIATLTAYKGETRRLLYLLGGLFAFVSLGWAADVISGPRSGLIWQGRYALPLFMASLFAPVEGLRTASREHRRLGLGLGLVIILVWNLACWQALRRWGVGESGTLLPWRWDTGMTALPPIVVAPLFGIGTVGLWWTLWWRGEPVDSRRAAPTNV